MSNNLTDKLTKQPLRNKWNGGTPRESLCDLQNGREQNQSALFLTDGDSERTFLMENLTCLDLSMKQALEIQKKTAVKLRSGIDCQKWSGLEYRIILQYSTQNLDRNENTFNLRYHHRPTKSELRARLVEIKFYGNRVYFFSAIMHEFLADSKQVNKLSKRPVSWLLSLITYVHPVVLCHFIHIIDHPY